MAIYTRSGDSLMTGLLSGERVRKDDFRIVALGAVDELNSAIGLLASLLPADCSETLSEMQKIQRDLFLIGTLITTSPGSLERERIEKEETLTAEELEAWIDHKEAELPELRDLILPSGNRDAAAAQMARSICRRTEITIVTLVSDSMTAEDKALEMIQIYLNRLSDYLFTVARYCNKLAGVEETLWKE